MSKPDGGPAFPEDYEGQYHGLTKREYFAAAALQGILAGFPDEKAFHPDYVATSVVRVADALIAALAEGEKP